MLCIRAVSKAMIQQEPKVHRGRHGQERSLGRGSIVNLGSLNSYIASQGMMAYAASKHAVLGITKVAGESSEIWKYISANKESDGFGKVWSESQCSLSFLGCYSDVGLGLEQKANFKGCG